MATVAAVVFEHHKKNDGTYNVKICIYHKSEKKYIDTSHFVSRKQLDGRFDIKDKFIIKMLKKHWKIIAKQLVKQQRGQSKLFKTFSL